MLYSIRAWSGKVKWGKWMESMKKKSGPKISYFYCWISLDPFAFHWEQVFSLFKNTEKFSCSAIQRLHSIHYLHYAEAFDQWKQFRQKKLRKLFSKRRGGSRISPGLDVSIIFSISCAILAAKERPRWIAFHSSSSSSLPFSSSFFQS